MAAQYQVVPTGSAEEGPPPSASGEGGAGAIQRFELEDDRFQGGGIKSRVKKLGGLACLFVVLLMALAGYGSSMSRRGDATTPEGGGESSPSGDNSVPNSEDPTGETTDTSTESKLVLCYGDSLTFGMTPQQRGGESYPYAKYLERELRLLYGDGPDSDSAPTVSVQHLGLPGWKASTMLDHVRDERVGLCPLIQRQRRPPPSIVILLAGTNDIGQMTDTGRSVGRAVLSSIAELHKVAMGCAEQQGDPDLRTVAIGIPGSSFQAEVPAAREMAAYVNGMLEEFAGATGGRVTYVEFPFGYKDFDLRWSEDGIHPTPAGYEELGKALSVEVKQILDGMGNG